VLEIQRNNTSSGKKNESYWRWSPLIRRTPFILCEQCFSKGYADLKAFTIFNRAARTAGRNPPTIPINTEKNSDQPTMAGDNENENSSSEKELKFSVDMEKN
jgi:hypothetical protein